MGRSSSGSGALGGAVEGAGRGRGAERGDGFFFSRRWPSLCDFPAPPPPRLNRRERLMVFVASFPFHVRDRVPWLPEIRGVMAFNASFLPSLYPLPWRTALAVLKALLAASHAMNHVTRVGGEGEGRRDRLTTASRGAGSRCG